MDFISTQGQSSPVPLEEAVLRGLAPDGGLYMPIHIPTVSKRTLSEMAHQSWPQLAAQVMRSLLSGSLPSPVMDGLVANALNFPIPLVHLRDQVFVLELFRGPTLAFKDVGARFLSGLLARILGESESAVGSPLTVLTATSGDTGGAVAQAFFGLPGIRVVVLFPDGKVTPRQERQFSTLGGNVTAVAVQGDFDDCQRLAKAAFREGSSPGDRAGLGHGALPSGPLLTSANSINIGRFLPQITYYFKAWAHFRTLRENRTSILFSVPSGNFGNLAAGLVAKAMGLADISFLAATNSNDVVPEYLRTGVYTPRPSQRTLSTAMDVGNPSNLDRILHLYGGNVAGLRKDLVGQRVTDLETKACIQRTAKETGYILDPHSAVGLAALETELSERPDTAGVLLATAHPAKFAEVVEPVMGRPLPVPPQLSQCLKRDRMVVPMEPRLEALMELL
jgi:threonine synthase